MLDALQSAFPNIQFQPGTTCSWSPYHQKVTYVGNADTLTEQQSWSLLHETGHALLGHDGYTSDFSLLQLEMAAWRKARELAKQFLSSPIDEDHIQDCLDTYRDWLIKRSTCPGCSTQTLQQNNTPTYHCHNCRSTWSVTASRFCRPYRAQKNTPAAARS